jgi:hypothetical protein
MKNTKALHVFWGSDGGDYVDVGVLGCNAVCTYR